MTTSQTPIQTGKKLQEIEHKEWLLREIKWFTEFAKRNPKHAAKAMDIVETYYKLYKQ